MYFRVLSFILINGKLYFFSKKTVNPKFTLSSTQPQLLISLLLIIFNLPHAKVFSHRDSQNYNALSIDDKILDGFYDFCSISSKSFTSKLPSLADLKETSLSDHIFWEAILVNRSEDPSLSKLEQKALKIASESKFGSLGFPGKFHVQKIAIMVSNYMGGPVGAYDNMSKTWNCYKDSLRKSINSNVLPIGHLTIGLSRHRALLFKVSK